MNDEPEEPPERPPEELERLREQARADRRQGWSLAQLKAKYGIDFQIDWLEGIPAPRRT